MRTAEHVLRTALVGCLVLGLLGCGADGSASGSPRRSVASPAASATQTPRATATPSATAHDEASPSPSVPAQTPAPDAQRTPWLPYGRWATVTADGLRVRNFLPDRIDDLDSVGATVDAGEPLFVVGPGPVAAHGYQWYEVAYGAAVGADGYVHATGTGVIAATSSQGDQSFVAWSEAGCPAGPLDAVTLAGLTGWALAHCEIGQLVDLQGMLNQPIEGPLTPFDYEPDWLRFARWYLTEPDEAGSSFTWSSWSIALHFAPELDTSALQRGDLVRIDGHIDDPAASGCRVIESAGEGGPRPSEHLQQGFRLGCSIAFVVDSIELTGHIDLAEL